MAKSKPSAPLNAADCARRTGITVKALRVYERNGLITPARSAKGWRLYGQKELVRLNAIAALKSVGLTLAQIRDAFETSSPQLPIVLRMQLDEWRARKDAAEKAISIVESALARLTAREQLSVDELCELIRSIEMQNVQVVARELINEMLTPEEERAWLTYTANLPKQEMAENREHFESARAITQAFVRLMQQGADPASAEVQRLLTRSNETALKYHFRERMITRDRWNPALAQKVYALGNRLIVKTSAKDVDYSESELLAFCTAARKASKWGKTLDDLVEQARALGAQGIGPESPAVQKLARRLAEVCTRYSLGDPMVYARWFTEFGKMQQGEVWGRLDDETRAAWKLLTEAAATCH